MPTDSTSSDAHLLMAELQLHQGNIKQAQQSLEVGLSYNFEVNINFKYLYQLPQTPGVASVIKS